MFLYRVKYTEPGYDIENNDLLYKIQQQHQTTFEMLENSEKEKEKYSTVSKFLFCIIYKFHNSYFVIWGEVCKLWSFGIFISIYITRVGLLHM